MLDVDAIPWFAHLTPLLEDPTRSEPAGAHPPPVRDPVGRGCRAAFGDDDYSAGAGGRALAVAHSIRRLADTLTRLCGDGEAVAARVSTGVVGFADWDGAVGVLASRADAFDLLYARGKDASVPAGGCGTLGGTKAHHVFQGRGHCSSASYSHGLWIARMSTLGSYHIGERLTAIATTFVRRIAGMLETHAQTSEAHERVNIWWTEWIECRHTDETDFQLY